MVKKGGMQLSNFKFERKNLSSQVADYIRKNIIFLNEYEGGEKISESNIAEELGVSRAPVREAFRELENQGLIESIPRKGSHVVNFTREDMREIFDIRVLLESRILESLINQEKLEEEDFKKLNKIVDEMVERTRTNDKRKLMQVNEKDLAFHKYLWEASGRKWTKKLLLNLHHQLQLAMVNDLKIEGNLEKSAKIHYEIVDYLQQEDLENTKEMLKEHIKVYKGSNF